MAAPAVGRLPLAEEGSVVEAESRRLLDRADVEGRPREQAAATSAS
jgi:hypothetical protein